MSQLISLSTLGDVKTFLGGMVGKGVLVCNEAEANQDEGKIGFAMSGTLESCEDSGGFYVRCRETYQGPEGVNFWPQHVLEGEKLSTGVIRIILKSGGSR